MDLPSGYNSLEPLVNLTGFTNEEFVSIKKDLIDRIDGLYYSRHKVLKYKNVFDRLIYLFKMIMFRPGTFVGKLKKRLYFTNKTA